MRIKTIVAAASALVFAASLSSCAATPQATPAPSASESVTPAPTPTPTPTPTVNAEDPTTWIISDAGVGPIEIGGDVQQTLSGLPAEWTNDAEQCSWTAWWNAPDSSYGMYFVGGPEAPEAPISEISVYTTDLGSARVPSPVTADGLGLGSTRADVQSAHPGVEERPAQIGDTTWLMLAGDGAAHVFFGFREGIDTASSVVVTTREEPSYEVCG